MRTGIKVHTVNKELSPCSGIWWKVSASQSAAAVPGSERLSGGSSSSAFTALRGVFGVCESGDMAVKANKAPRLCGAGRPIMG